jgi:hypothetical protein
VPGRKAPPRSWIAPEPRSVERAEQEAAIGVPVVDGDLTHVTDRMLAAFVRVVSALN